MMRGIMLAITGGAMGYMFGAVLNLDVQSIAASGAVLCVCVVYWWRAGSALESD